MKVHERVVFGCAKPYRFFTEIVRFSLTDPRPLVQLPSQSRYRSDRALPDGDCFSMNRNNEAEAPIAAFLRPAFCRCLLKVIGGDHVMLAESWPELRFLLKTTPIAVVLADPRASGRLETDSIADLLKNFPATPVWAYVSLTAAEFKSVAYLSRQGLQDVILHGSDDSVHLLESTLSNYRSAPFVAEILRTMKPQLDKLPMRIEKTIRDVFQRPQLYRTALDMCRDASVTNATLYRCCQNARLCPPKRIIVAAKALRGFAYLRDPGASIQSVATKLGYADVRGFAAHVQQIFLGSPSIIRSGGQLRDPIGSIQTWLRNTDTTSRSLPYRRASNRRARPHTTARRHT